MTLFGVLILVGAAAVWVVLRGEPDEPNHAPDRASQAQGPARGAEAAQDTGADSLTDRGQSIEGITSQDLAAVFRKLKDPEANALLAQLDAHYRAGQIDSKTCSEVARVSRSRGNGEIMEQWAVRACTKLIADKGQDLKVGHMVEMVNLFQELHLSGGYPEFTSMMVTLARNGSLDAGEWDHSPATSRMLGRLLLTHECRQALRLRIEDARGWVRPGVAEPLTWAYRNSRAIGEWTEYLDQKIASTEGDAKAHWLIARAYTQAVTVNHGTDPLEARELLNQALSEAASVEGRLYVARRIAMAYAFFTERKKGEAFLKSIEGQFTGEGAAGFAKLRADFSKVCGQNEQWLEKKRQAVKASRLRYARHDLMVKIRTARELGNTELAEKLERQLAELK